MHCHVETVEFAGRPTQVIVCGSGPRKKFCRYCGARATALCDWPRVRREEVALDQLKVGDLVFVFAGAKEQQEVVYVKPRPAEGEVWLACAWHGKVIQHVFQPWRKVFRAVQGTCDAPCCYRCLRHVGPDVDYCRRHWTAWESA